MGLGLKAGAQLPDGYEALSVGNGTHDVVIRTKVKKDIEKRASQEQRAGLSDIVQKYVEGGSSAIPSKKFNGNEGWFPSEKAQGKILLQAFKPRQLRAYGFCRPFDGRPTFFITGVDTAKKQDQANQNILNAAGTEAAEINKALGKLK